MNEILKPKVQLSSQKGCPLKSQLIQVTDPVRNQQGIVDFSVPCAKEKCIFYDEQNKECIFIQIFKFLKELKEGQHGTDNNKHSEKPR